jgi:preprotein translocase subunit SecD
MGALAAALAAFSAHYDAFWAMVVLGLTALWGIILALPVMDIGWRARFSMLVSAVILAWLCMWPTLSAMTSLPLPEYIRDNITFKLVAGLDLRGGLRLAYSVEVEEALRDRRDRRYEEMRVELAKLFDLHDGDDPPTEETYTKLAELVELKADAKESHRIEINVKPGADPQKIDARFLTLFGADLAFSRSEDARHYEFTLKESSASEIRSSAVAQAKDIILRRVDELGLREASVSTRDEDVIVEVPGQDEATFDEIREIIGQTARLEFKLLDDDSDFFGAMSRDAAVKLPEDIEFRAEAVPVGADKDGEPIRKTSTYVAITRKEAESNKEALARIKAWASTLELPPDRELGFEIEQSVDPDTLESKESGWRTYFLRSRAEITGDQIRDAQAVPDQSQGGMGGWYVALTFTEAGGASFERITGANIKRRFAIILDDRIESAPVIQARIAGGHASITMGAGNPQDQLKDSRKLELVLRSGALPAPIVPSNEQHIGPSLGESSIALAIRGAGAGALAVLVFMVFYYRRAGLIADFAVLLNLFLQMAILATFGASMTLPGIAGLALTIGMSVDANVLINERIRDELRDGKSPRAAVETGYARAFSAILDGHFTTFMSAIVLAQFGSGPIKGFAVTLMVGIVASMYTGVFVTRLVFDMWVRGMTRTSKLDVG